VSARLHASLQARLPAALQISTASSARKSKMLTAALHDAAPLFLFASVKEKQ
jgi:hypothetical protein